jgi:hypothetical protein
METPTADELMAKLESAPLAQAEPDPVTSAEPAPENAPASEPAPEQEPVPAGDTPPEPAPDADPAPEASPAPANPAADPDEAQGRYRLKGKLAAVAQLTKEGMDEQEAIDRVYGKAVEASPEPEKEPAPDPIALLETEQAEVQARLDQAAEDGSVLTPALRKDMKREAEITLEIRDAKAAKAEAERQQAQAAEAKEDEQWNDEVGQVIELYGDAAKDDGVLGKAILNEYDKAAADPKHPFHALWNNNTLTPLVMAPYVAAKIGVQPVAKATPTAPIAAAPEAKRPAVSGAARTVPNPVNNQAAVEAARKERLVKAASSGSAEEMEKIFAEANSPNGSAPALGFRLG